MTTTEAIKRTIHGNAEFQLANVEDTQIEPLDGKWMYRFHQGGVPASLAGETFMTTLYRKEFCVQVEEVNEDSIIFKSIPEYADEHPRNNEGMFSDLL